MPSLLLYVTSIYFFNTLFQVSNFDIQFLLKVGIITSVCWLPIWGFKQLVDWYDPNAAMKVRANNRSSAAAAAAVAVTVAAVAATAAAVKNVIPNGKSALCRSEGSPKLSKAAKR